MPFLWAEEKRKQFVAAKELIDREFVAAHPMQPVTHDEADSVPFEGIIDPTLVVFRNSRCYVMSSSFKGKLGVVELYSAKQALLRLDIGKKVVVNRHCVLM